MHLKNIIYGLIIGIGFIIPGVSGGVLATILGIYNDAINRLNNFKKNIKDNLLYLGNLFIGLVLGIILFSKIILYFFNNNIYSISYIFIGLILGSIPYLIKVVKYKCNQNINLVVFVITFIIGVLLFLAEKNITTSTSISLFRMFIGGIFYSIGKIVPGISGSSLLIFLGIYEYLLNIISNPLSINLSIIRTLIPFFTAFILFSILLLKLINILFNKQYRNTFSAIIGFSLSSTLFIYPGNINIINIILLIISFIISYLIIKKKTKLN